MHQKRGEDGGRPRLLARVAGRYRGLSPVSGSDRVTGAVAAVRKQAAGIAQITGLDAAA